MPYQRNERITTKRRQPVRKAEDDVASIAKTVADNYFDHDLTSGFLDLVVQL